jgi:hypothetical protein
VNTWAWPVISCNGRQCERNVAMEERNAAEFRVVCCLLLVACRVSPSRCFQNGYPKLPLIYHQKERRLYAVRSCPAQRQTWWGPCHARRALLHTAKDTLIDNCTAKSTPQSCTNSDTKQLCVWSTAQLENFLFTAHTTKGRHD